MTGEFGKRGDVGDPGPPGEDGFPVRLSHPHLCFPLALFFGRLILFSDHFCKGSFGVIGLPGLKGQKGRQFLAKEKGDLSLFFDRAAPALKKVGEHCPLFLSMCLCRVSGRLRGSWT